MKTHSLDEADLWLAGYFRKRNGVFLEAGANDGINQSNTALLAEEYGWTGVLIEPIPEIAELARRNRPESVVIQAALVPSDYGAATIKMYSCNLMSIVEGGMRDDEADRKHVQLGEQVQGISSSELLVPTTTLNDVFREHLGNRIDLLCLDVEGFEGPALRGLDFSRFLPRIILVEARFQEEVRAVIPSFYDIIHSIGYYDQVFRFNRLKWLRQKLFRSSVS